MAQTPSKLQPIELETIDGYAYDGTNARVVDKMPMAHITDSRDSACLLQSSLKTTTCPDFTAIDCIYGWSPKSWETSATHNSTRLHGVTYSMCHCVSVCAYLGIPGRQPYSVSEAPSKTRRFLSFEVTDGYTYGGTNARAIEVCLWLLFNGSRARACLMTPILKTNSGPDMTAIEVVDG